MATYSNDTPMPRSPAAESLQGLEPDLVYSAMFWFSASRYFHPASSPIRWRMEATERYPVPDEAGFGITTWPLYTGLVRSAHEAGLHVVLLGDESRGDVAGREPQHLDVEVRQRLLVGLAVLRDLLVLDRRIDHHGLLLGQRGRGGQRGQQDGGQREAGGATCAVQHTDLLGMRAVDAMLTAP